MYCATNDFIFIADKTNFLIFNSKVSDLKINQDYTDVSLNLDGITIIQVAKVKKLGYFITNDGKMKQHKEKRKSDQITTLKSKSILKDQVSIKAKIQLHKSNVRR